MSWLVPCFFGSSITVDSDTSGSYIAVDASPIRGVDSVAPGPNTTAIEVGINVRVG